MAPASSVTAAGTALPGGHLTDLIHCTHGIIRSLCPCNLGNITSASLLLDPFLVKARAPGRQFEGNSYSSDTGVCKTSTAIGTGVGGNGIKIAHHIYSGSRRLHVHSV